MVMEPMELVVYPPGEGPIRHTLEESLVTLGRGAACSIHVRDRFLSRLHIEFLSKGGSWFVRDMGSANGTWLNGRRVEGAERLHVGDTLSLGETEIMVGGKRTDQVFALDDRRLTPGLSIPIVSSESDETASGSALDRAMTINELARELLEDRSLDDLFEFILDRVRSVMRPSRVAIALFGRDWSQFAAIKLRSDEESEDVELVISRTILGEVVREKKVVSIIDVGEDEKLSQAKSIALQNIRSAICAPLIVADQVIGVLYVDFLIGMKDIGDDDVRLMAQIARFAAAKVETTRLREQASAKEKMEEELRTAYLVQSRLLPAAPPVVDGWDMAGLNRPARMVSGDYYDFIIADSGLVWFFIADVSGKGITAGLLMSSLSMAVEIFVRDAPTPARLLGELNRSLAPRLSPAKFVSLFAGCIDPARPERVAFANAGHCLPLHVRRDSVEEVGETDIVLGVVEDPVFRDQSVDLAPGDSLVLFTDGIAEAENFEGEEFGADGVIETLSGSHGRGADATIATVEGAVDGFIGDLPQADDVTILVVNRRRV
jgi:sigma-B regulation protein RsbU (phosphoserine phosphatase)